MPTSLSLIEPPRRRARISLTPLVDVVFILLVFFMLASSFLEWRSIDLGAPAPVAAGAAGEGALLVELRGDGGLRLSGEPVTPDALEARLRERLTRNPDQQVLVQADAGVALQVTVAVLDRIAASGAHDVSLSRGRAQ